MTKVVLKFNYIDDEIQWPEFNGGKMVSGWVTAVAGSRRVLLNVIRIKRIYAYGGDIYVVYNAESVDRYSKYVAPLPPLAVELDFDIHYQQLYSDGGCTCKIWRLSINSVYEEERFIKKLLDVEVEMEHTLSNASYPLNFTMLPIDVTLYMKHIGGIAVVKNPRFRLCNDGDAYRGKYVVLADETSFSLYRIKGDVDISQMKKRLLERLQYEVG